MEAEEGDEHDGKMFSLCTGNAFLHIRGAFLTSILVAVFCFCFVFKQNAQMKKNQTKYSLNHRGRLFIKSTLQMEFILKTVSQVTIKMLLT